MLRSPACRALAALGVLLSTAASSDPTPGQKLRPQSSDSRVLIIAHRGCWGEAPEVSVAAIRACEGSGADGVEIDVQRTRDGALVLIHDDTVDRTTNGTGAVSEMSLAAIRRLRLRKGPGGPNALVTDHRIATLEEGLRAAKGKFIVHLDYKTASIEEIAAVVRKVGMEGQVTAWLRGLPDAPTQPDPVVADSIVLVPVIVDCAPGTAPCRSARPDALDAYARYRPAGYFLTYRATRAFVEQAANADRPAGTWIATETLGPVDNLPLHDRRKEWQALIDLGVSMILTDHPKDLAAFLNDTKRR